MKTVLSLLLLLLSLFTLTGCHGHHRPVVSHYPPPPAKQWRQEHTHGYGYAAREPRYYR